MYCVLGLNPLFSVIDRYDSRLWSSITIFDLSSRLAKYLVLLVTPITQALGQSDTRIEKLSKQAYLIFQDLFIYIVMSCFTANEKLL